MENDVVLLSQENYAYGTIGGTCFQRISYVELFLQLKKNRYQIGEAIDVTVQGWTKKCVS